MPDFQFQGLADFLAMGGDAVFVWSSYGVFAAVIAYNLIQPAMEKRRILKNLRARSLREAARETAAREQEV